MIAVIQRVTEARVKVDGEEIGRIGQGLAVLFDLMSAANQDIWALTIKDALELRVFLTETLTMLGFTNLELKIPNDVIRLVERRELFRRSKQFIQSDDLRKQIEALGYVVEDTRRGPLVLPRAAS